MRTLKLEITSMDDVRVLTTPPPPGFEFRLDPDFASPPPPKGMTFDDASGLLHWIVVIAPAVIVGAKVVKDSADAGTALLKFMEQLNKLKSPKGFKVNGEKLPADIEARRRRLLEMLNDPEE